jgi:hypothetical protein
MSACHCLCRAGELATIKCLKMLEKPTHNQAKAIKALLEQPTIQEAADKMGFITSTIYR